MTLTTITFLPAYGRDYKNREAVLADWKAGKDFRIEGGGGMVGSRDDLVQAPERRPLHVNFRYAKLGKIFSIPIAEALRE